MNEIEMLSKLQTPQGVVDMVLDTDAFNEIDDQFAIAYALRSTDQVNVKALYAAPFFNEHSTGPKDGMERSFDEILKLLALAKREELIPFTFRGSECYLPDEHTPVMSDAVNDLIARARSYTPNQPLYVVAIGAITNVASAILAAPDIIDRIVLVWLGGSAWHYPATPEFNMMQDIAAARVVFGCGVPLVQLPCMGVVSAFTTTKPELEYWLAGKNPLADYLARNTIKEAEAYAAGKPWSRVIWDVTTVAWLCDREHTFLCSTVEHAPVPEYGHGYSFDPRRHFMRYVYAVNRDALMQDLFAKLLQE